MWNIRIKKLPGVWFEPTRITRLLDLKSNALTTESPVYFTLLIIFINKTIGDKAKIKQNFFIVQSKYYNLQVVTCKI